MPNYIITKTPEFFKKIGTYNYCNLEDMILPDTIAYDSETLSLKPINGEIFAIQIGTGENNYLIHCYDNNYQPKDVAPYLKNKILIGQNITFDLKWLYKYGIYPDKVKDTFIASKLLYNGLLGYRHGFAYIFEREMGLIYDKSEQENIHKIKLSTSKAIEYCFNDVDKLLDLHAILLKKIQDQGYSETYELHCNYIKALAYMEHGGCPIDLDKWKNKIKQDIITLKVCEENVVNYIYDNLPKYRNSQIDMFSNEKKLNILLSSPKQLIPVFNDFGINTLTDEGKDSIGENTIRQSNHEFVKIWLDYQSASHDVTTFGENIFNKVIDNRIYSSFNPVLDTARISTSKGDINTLNLPANERTRECITARPGYKMIVSDYSGQETHTGADITNDEAMIISVVNDSDLHCAFARILFPELKSLSDEEIMTNYKKERNAAKGPRFCFQFGGTGWTLAKNEGKTLEEGDRIEKLYKELHPGIYQYGENKLKEAMDLGYIESCMGFKLHLPNYEEFKRLELVNKNIDWDLYREGKEIYKAEKKAVEAKKEYTITNYYCYNYYLKHYKNVKRYFKIRSKYFRLVLNNPTQTTAAHQTKLAVSTLFQFIKDNNHIDKVCICIVPHDEIVLECIDELVPLYTQKLGEIMVTCGNKLIKNPKILMKAKAHSGLNWYEAK